MASLNVSGFIICRYLVYRCLAFSLKCSFPCTPHISWRPISCKETKQEEKEKISDRVLFQFWTVRINYYIIVHSYHVHKNSSFNTFSFVFLFFFSFFVTLLILKWLSIYMMYRFVWICSLKCMNTLCLFFYT
jgi:hypothetical protein